MGGFMSKRIAGLVAVVVAAPLTLLVAGMRWKLSPVLTAVRRLNRSVTNPRVMRTAGTVGTQTSVIEHIGRKSGRAYATPVDVVPTRTGFLIALPYGMQADWLRNVLAAGSATVVTNGERVEVGAPMIVPTADVASLIPARTLRTLRLFSVDTCLHLERESSSV
jgi:deazaflavin-dependent oxidoreductase (nitroreductase family)